MEYDLSPGDRLGHFVLIEHIATGRSAHVWKAFDDRLDRTVALKILHDPQLADEFLDEGLLLASLRHPNVVRVYERKTFTRRGRNFDVLVLEWIDGAPLRDVLRQGGFEFCDAMRICREIAGGVAALHAVGASNRELPHDISPGNILVDDDLRPVLIDVAPIRGGTLGFMAPEVFGPGPLDGKADVFSPAAVIFQILSRRRPFPGDDPLHVRDLILRRGPDLTLLPPRTPERVVSLLARALDPDPARRPGVTELARVFDAPIHAHLL